MALRSLRARITMAMVAVTVGVLVVTGVVTLVFTARTARYDTRRQLERVAVALAVNLAQRDGLRAVAVTRLLRALAGPLALEGAKVDGLSPLGRLYPLGDRAAAAQLPSGLTIAQLDLPALEAGDVVSGARRATVFAAAPFSLQLLHLGRPVTLHGVVVITRTEPSGALRTLPWLLASTLGAIAVAVVVADGMSRRIVRPVRAAEDATARIAGGDLSARVELSAGADGELVELAAAINTMGDELTRSRQAQRQYFLSVSHDLRTPLSAIRGYAEALEDGAVDPVQAGGVITSESRRLERLVQDVLELGRLELRQFSLRPQPVELGGIIEGAVAAFGPAAAELGLTLQAVSGPRQWVTADPDRLGQVVANLAENALNHAATSVSVGSAGAALWVDDDGPGIGPEGRERLFEPFTTADGYRRRIGTGLGLAIVAELVAAMGGSIDVASPLHAGRGTRMTVALPPAGAGLAARQ
ncbi:MAG: HAMP domain-containing sensor histidine kinase [Actinomycetota bacterium]|nr:HAMP domain-containing sensor histidine kinase [Actinomycetota bacterium]